MAGVKGANNQDHEVEVSQAVHVSWSVGRCLHGADVKIQVRAQAVKDDAKAVLEVLPSGGGAALKKFEDVALDKGKKDEECKVDWDLGEATHFVVKAVVDGDVEGTSKALRVEASPPSFSF